MCFVLDTMTLYERAQNLQENYSELIGYAYLARLIKNDMSTVDGEYTDEMLSAVSTIFGFMLQKIGDLKYDLKYLVADVLESDGLSWFRLASGE